MIDFKLPLIREFNGFLILLVIISVISCSTKSTPSYQLTTSVTPAEGGSVSPASGEWDEGEEVELTATANQGWMFDGWEGDQTGSQNPVTITMSSDMSVTARFMKRLYPLTINVEGSGTVTETVVQAKTTDYEFGTVVQLEANSDMGYQFARWSGDIESMENPVTITLDGPKEVTAVFEVMEYNVVINTDGPGTASVTPEKESYQYNETVMFKAVPDNDVEFLGWLNESGSFDMREIEFDYQITENLDITAFFSTVKNAIVIETSEVNENDGKVHDIKFRIINYLPQTLYLEGADIENEKGKDAALLRLDPLRDIISRNALDLRLTFEGNVDNVSNTEIMADWVFEWMFTYKEKDYIIRQKVGTVASKVKSNSPPFLHKQTESIENKVFLY